MAEWFEDEELWRTLLPVLFSPDIVAKAPAEIDSLLKLAPLAAGAAVLDMPCGVGRHSVEMARRGLRVTGVDRTNVFLDLARQAAESAGTAIELVRGDMRTFRREGAFDAVLNLWTSFGYWEDPAEDGRVLGNYFACVKPGGVLVMELLGKEGLGKHFMPTVWRELPDGTLLLQKHTIEDHWGAVANQWIIVKGSERREVRFKLRLYSATELSRLVREAGFVDVRCFNGLAGGAYDHAANRLAVVARRPG